MFIEAWRAIYWMYESGSDMSGAISQLQVVYSPEEDRILFRVNTTEQSEFRFWFSRRYTMLLLRVLHEHQARDPDVVVQQAPEARQAVQSFKQEQSAQSANMSKQFEASTRRPLGEDAILAHRLTYKINDDQLNLGIAPKEGQGINIGINRDINNNLTRLLLAAAKQGEWGITIQAGHRPSEPAQEKPVIN
ncbi:MAG: hypothetical protein AAF525_20775 [Pseudomonadota bacterium]